jgi:hypothetical protein
MFVSSDFKFNAGDPTKCHFNDTVLTKRRSELVSDTIEEIKVVLGLANQYLFTLFKHFLYYSQGKGKQMTYANMDPLNIQESMEPDDDEELANIERFMQKKIKKA